jgi:parallel beta-helix repeat protein
MTRKYFIFLASVVTLLFNPLNSKINAEVKINEFMTLNVMTYPDMCDYNDFTDWVELYNPGDAEVSLNGYFLTDNLKKPKQWAFPSDAKIPAKGYFMLRADGKDCGPGKIDTLESYDWNVPFTTKRYHTNFKLSDLSEELGLYKSTGTGTEVAVVDSVEFTRQLADVSMGRSPSDGQWYKYDTPTPEGPNSTVPKPLETIQASPGPAFSIPGGYYSAPQTVKLSVPAAGFGTYVTPNTEIYYTTDGSIPRQNTAIKYTGPITVNSTTVIRARCFDPGYITGAIVTHTFFINEKARGLMVVSMATDSSFLFDNTIGLFTNSMKNREVPVNMEFITTEGKQVAKVRAGLALGSLTNFTCPQKPMQIALKGKYGDDFIWYQLFAKRASCYPKLRFRQGGDAWSTNLIADGMLESMVNGQLELGMQAYRPVVLFINGKYYGIQDMREQFDDQYFNNNFNLDVTTKEEVRTQFQPVPGKEVEGWQVVSGSMNNWNALIALVKTGDMTAEKYNKVKDQVNINSLIDFISCVTFGDQISWGHNEDIWKVGGSNPTKWQWLVTDFDRAMVYKDNLTDVSHNIFTSGRGVSGSLLQQDTLFFSLMKNAEFKNYFAQRLAAHLNSTFKPERLESVVDSLKGMLLGEMTEYTAKWGPLGGIKSVTEWKATLETVKLFIEERGGYILQHLQAAPISMDSTKRLTVALSKTGAGEIYINEVHMSQGLDTMKFFRGAPFLVKAYANPGYVFTGWKGGPSTDTTTVVLSGDSAITAEFEVSQDHIMPLSITKDTTLRLIDKPYIASGTVEVARGATLTIEKGVTIAMAQDAGIYVKGKLLILGTADAPVNIKSNEKAGVTNWAAICLDTAQDTNKILYLTVTGPSLGRDPLNQRAAINGNATPKVIIDHLSMPDADYPMYFEGCDVALTNSTIIINHICNGGIHVGRGPCLVQNNTWISTGKTMNSDGIDVKGVENGVVRGNRLYNFNGFNSDGIDLGESCKSILIEGNFIYGNRDKGVSCGGKSTCTMRNNIIVECDMAIGIKDDGSYANIDHNTFIRCNKAVNLYEKSYTRGGGISTVRNTIFSGCKIASIMTDRNSTVDASYNLSDMDIIPGTGNLMGSPKFLDPLKSNFQVSDQSPCLNAGDPNASIHSAGWKNIGANYTFSASDFPVSLVPVFSNSIVINEIMYNDNPAFNSGDWVELHNPTDKEIDMSGWKFTNQDLPDPVTWVDVPSLSYVDTMTKDSNHVLVMPAGTKIASKGYLVICRTPKNFIATYPGVTNRLADSLTFKLKSTDRLALYSANDSFITEVTYRDKAPWPVAANGGGVSLELRNPNFFNYYTGNWGTSASAGGTPGKENSIINTFVINAKNMMLPDRFYLAQNYPNPCKSITSIVFSLPSKDHVQLAIYNLGGRKLETLVDSEMKAGTHKVAWDARKYSPGVYLYRMKTNNFTQIMKANVR